MKWKVAVKEGKDRKKGEEKVFSREKCTYQDASAGDSGHAGGGGRGSRGGGLHNR